MELIYEKWQGYYFVYAVDSFYNYLMLSMGKLRGCLIRFSEIFSVNYIFIILMKMLFNLAN